MAASEIDYVDFAGKILKNHDIQVCLNKLRYLVSEDNVLKKNRADDGYLLRFLFCTNFNVTEAFDRLQAYCNFTLENPEWFASGPPMEGKHRMKDNDRLVLDGRDNCGRRILVIKLGKVNVELTSPEVHSQFFDIYMECLMEESEIKPGGVAIIIDMKGYSWKMYRWLTPANLRIAVRKLDLFPIRDIVFHVINTSFLVSTSIKFAWPFLSDNTKKMIKFHFNNFPSLHEYVDAALLPPEYGGTGAEFDYEKSNKFILDKSSELERRFNSRVATT